MQAKRPLILVVDDSEIVRGFLRVHLSQPPLEAVVVEAADGALAIHRALEEEFDCVLCDLTMPVMDGLAFLKALRQHRSKAQLPVVLLTGSEDVDCKVEAFRAGASDFIVKSCEPIELVARVETQLSLAQMYRVLQHEAERDPLTAVLNRRSFVTQCEREILRALRGVSNVSLLMLDVDFFKRINDTRGHPVGDAVLISLAQTLGARMRSYDSLGRMGGEEFAVLLPGVALPLAAKIAERLREAVVATGLGPYAPGEVTISIGAAEAPIGLDDSVAALVRRADENLYEAKHGGRNRVCAHPHPRVAIQGDRS